VLDALGDDPSYVLYLDAHVAHSGREADRAAWLERSHEARSPALPTLWMNHDMANLHDASRWDPFWEKVGLPASSSRAEQGPGRPLSGARQGMYSAATGGGCRRCPQNPEAVA